MTLSVKSTMSCTDDAFRRFWVSTYGKFEFLITRGDEVLDLTHFADVWPQGQMSKFVGQILFKAQSQDLNEAFNEGLDTLEFDRTLIGILEQIEGNQWKGIAQHFEMRHQTQPRMSVFRPYRDAWDNIGIYRYPDYIHVSLYLRSSELRGVEYLPVSDVREPGALEYAEFRPTLENLLEYARIGMALKTKMPLILHPLFNEMNAAQARDFITLCVKATLIEAKHPLIRDFHTYETTHQPSDASIRFAGEYPTEFGYIRDVYGIPSG